MAWDIQSSSFSGRSARLYILSTNDLVSPLSNSSTSASSLYPVSSINSLKEATNSSAELVPCLNLLNLCLAVPFGSGSEKDCLKSLRKEPQDGVFSPFEYNFIFLFAHWPAVPPFK